MIAICNIYSKPLDFFLTTSVLQAKVDIDLLKFELLLSAAEDCLNQVLSSSTEGIPLTYSKRILVSQGKPS
jgi:hypothetical protein